VGSLPTFWSTTGGAGDGDFSAGGAGVEEGVFFLGGWRFGRAALGSGEGVWSWAARLASWGSEFGGFRRELRVDTTRCGAGDAGGALVRVDFLLGLSLAFAEAKTGLSPPCNEAFDRSLSG